MAGADACKSQAPPCNYPVPRPARLKVFDWASCYHHVELVQWRRLNLFNKERVLVSAHRRGQPHADGMAFLQPLRTGEGVF